MRNRRPSIQKADLSEPQECLNDEEKPVTIQYMTDEYELDSLGTGNAQMLSTEHSENTASGSFYQQNNVHEQLEAGQNCRHQLYNSTNSVQAYGSVWKHVVSVDDEY